MTHPRIDAFLALRSEGRVLVGRDRIRLLEAVAEHGNITRAAKATGFSYKTAWEAVNAINNLLPSPAFVTRTGGRAGGGAEVTAEGRRLIATFRRLEKRLAEISGAIAEEGLERQEEALLWMLGAQVSARNVFQSEVVEVRRGAVDVDVVLKITGERSLVATVTNSAATSLALEPGRKVLALVKAPFVRLARTGDERAANLFPGTVTSRVDGEHNSEVALDIGEGRTLVAVAPAPVVERLGLKPGDRAAATFEPDHVILAVN